MNLAAKCKMDQTGKKIRPVRELPTKFSKGKISIVYINVMAPEVAITSVVRDIVSEEFPSSDD